MLFTEDELEGIYDEQFVAAGRGGALFTRRFVLDPHMHSDEQPA